MSAAFEIINTKQLRADLPRVLRRVSEGNKFLVLHRSHPAFELSPPGGSHVAVSPLEKDPVFNMRALGKSQDGASSVDHDHFLYGG